MKKLIKKINKDAPKELARIFEQTLYFQSRRLAEELWDIGERILKGERLWRLRKMSSLLYQGEKESYNITLLRSLIKREENGLCFHYLNKKTFRIDSIFLAKSREIFPYNKDISFLLANPNNKESKIVYF